MCSDVVELYKLFALIITASIACLAALALSYWIIMKQDSTVLTTVSASIGGIVGYYLKALRDKLREKG